MQRIKGFDGLRAFAVLTVISTHTDIWNRLGVKGDLLALLDILGVPFFFVLSGFLITSLLLAEHGRTGSVDIRAFYMRRALRIWPLYLLAVALLVVLQMAGIIRLERCTWFHALTHTVNFTPKACQFGPISHFWSLAVEEHYYLLWPFLFLLGRRFALAALAVILLVCQLLLWNYGVLLEPFESTYEPGRWTLPAVLPIAIGALAAFYVRSPISKAPFTSRLAPAALAAGIALIYTQRLNAAWYTGIACVLLFVYYNQESLLTRALEWKPIAFIGTISYGLYVWQGILGGNGPYRQFAGFPPPADLGILLTFLVAPLSYYFFEKPIMRWKKRWKSVPLVQASTAIGTTSR